MVLLYKNIVEECPLSANDAILLDHSYLNLVSISFFLIQTPKVPYPSSVTAVLFLVSFFRKPLECVICVQSLHDCSQLSHPHSTKIVLSQVAPIQSPVTEKLIVFISTSGYSLASSSTPLLHVGLSPTFALAVARL